MHVKLEVAFVKFEGKNVRLATVADITAEVDIQTQLVEMNAHLQMASEIAGLGYWTNDLKQGKIQWSGDIYKIFEVEPETFKLTLDNIKRLFCLEDQRQFEPEVIGNLEHNTIKEAECRIVTKTGKLKWILERQYLSKDKDGVPVRIQGIVLDITERKLHEQKIFESNERFKMLTKATVEAIIDWDIVNNEVTWGEGFQTMLGYDLAKADYRLWSNNIHPEDKGKVLSALQMALFDPKQLSFNAEFRFLKANGDIAYIQHKGIFIRDEKGKATRALGAMIDLTEALERMRKMEWQERTLKDIAWIQSHIVRAPLANLMGLIALIKDDLRAGVSDKVLIGHISDSAEKLDKIIHDIVDKTNDEKGNVANPKPVL